MTGSVPELPAALGGSSAPSPLAGASTRSRLPISLDAAAGHVPQVSHSGPVHIGETDGGAVASSILLEAHLRHCLLGTECVDLGAIRGVVLANETAVGAAGHGGMTSARASSPWGPGVISAFRSADCSLRGVRFTSRGLLLVSGVAERRREVNGSIREDGGGWEPKAKSAGSAWLRGAEHADPRNVAPSVRPTDPAVVA